VLKNVRCTFGFYFGVVAIADVFGREFYQGGCIKSISRVEYEIERSGKTKNTVDTQVYSPSKSVAKIINANAWSE